MFHEKQVKSLKHQTWTNHSLKLGWTHATCTILFSLAPPESSTVRIPASLMLYSAIVFVPSSNMWRAKWPPVSAANAPKHQVELLLSCKLSHSGKLKTILKRKFHIQKNDVAMFLGDLTEILWWAAADFLKGCVFHTHFLSTSYSLLSKTCLSLRVFSGCEYSLPFEVCFSSLSTSISKMGSINNIQLLG